MTFTADLHSHSHFSDGKQSPLTMYRRAQELGLDYFALTDHNTVGGVLELEAQLTDEDLAKTRLIPGFELSLMSGHWLVLGIDAKLLAKRIEKWGLRPGSFSELVSGSKTVDMFRWVNETDGILIAAHPCVPTRVMSAPAKMVHSLFESGLLQGMEIHNHDAQRKLGPLYRYWHQRVKRMSEEWGVPAYANSDAHTLDRLGRYFNNITMGEVDLLTAIRTQAIQIEQKQVKPSK